MTKFYVDFTVFSSHCFRPLPSLLPAWQGVHNLIHGVAGYARLCPIHAKKTNLGGNVIIYGRCGCGGKVLKILKWLKKASSHPLLWETDLLPIGGHRPKG